MPDCAKDLTQLSNEILPIATVTSLMLIPDLIVSVLDFFSDDIHTLCQCSLVSKQWLHFARHQLFNDLTIKLCVRPTGHDFCHKCISHFADLVSSRNCSIPHSIRTLTLTGKDTEPRWINIWSLVGNAGGMQKPEVVLALMRYFRSVERLVMIDLNWFNPPTSSSRTVTRFLSSIKSLILNNVRFYAGPRSLIWMLDRMSSLDVLLICSISWPARLGYPNNPSPLLVFSMNATFYYPLLFRPICKVLLGMSWVEEKIKPRTSRFALQKPLCRLAIELHSPEKNEVWFPWLLSQVQMLRSTTTLLVAIMFDEDQEPAITLQDLLDASDSLLHLRIHLHISSNKPITSYTSLRKQSVLETLEIQIPTLDRIAPHMWIQWLKDVLHTATSSCLTTIRIMMHSTNSELANIANSMADIEDCVNAIPSLRRLEIFVGLLHGQSSGPSAGWSRLQCIEVTKELFTMAFRLCDAKGILIVKAIWGHIDDSLERDAISEHCIVPW